MKKIDYKWIALSCTSLAAFFSVLSGIIWSWTNLREVEQLPEHQKIDLSGTLTFSFGMLLFLVALSPGVFAAEYGQ